MPESLTQVRRRAAATKAATRQLQARALHVNLRALKKARGMSNNDIAQATGLSKSQVDKWASGRAVPQHVGLAKLAALFGVVDPASLLSTDGPLMEGEHLPAEGGNGSGGVPALLDTAGLTRPPLPHASDITLKIDAVKGTAEVKFAAVLPLEDALQIVAMVQKHAEGATPADGTT